MGRSGNNGDTVSADIICWCLVKDERMHVISVKIPTSKVYKSKRSKAVCRTIRLYCRKPSPRRAAGRARKAACNISMLKLGWTLKFLVCCPGYFENLCQDKVRREVGRNTVSSNMPQGKENPN